MTPRKQLEITIPATWSEAPIRIEIFSLASAMIVGGVVLVAIGADQILPHQASIPTSRRA